MEVWTLAIVAVLCILVAQQGGVSGAILLNNDSTRVVTISWNASNPAQPCLLLAPGEQTGTLPPATYFFTNVHTTRGDLSLDGFIYDISNSAVHDGLVCVVREFLANHITIPVTGDF